jgi:ABC-type spermidine/putrescine transport system permease subunit I
MSIGLWQLIIVLFFAFVVGFPVARILSRMGYSKAWALLVLVPLVNWIALWVLAYAKWPALNNDVETFE